MSLAIGDVTVNPDLSHSGSGWSLSLYLADKTYAEANLPQWQDYDPESEPAGWDEDTNGTWSAFVTGLRYAYLTEAAAKAQLQAWALKTYLTGNAEVTTNVTDTDAGLQLLPATLAEDEPTKAPAATKQLTGTLA